MKTDAPVGIHDYTSPYINKNRRKTNYRNKVKERKFSIFPKKNMSFYHTKEAMLFISRTNRKHDVKKYD